MLVVVLAAVVAAKLVEMLVKRCRAKREELGVFPQRFRLLRRLLRLRRQDGFRLPSERLSWVQRLGLAAHPSTISAKPIKHLAMLTLLRRRVRSVWR